MLRFLRDNGVNSANEADCFYMIKYFDSDNDGKLNYSDFMQLIMPCDHTNLRAEIAQRQNYYVSKTDFLPQEVEEELAKLIERELSFNRVLEHNKQVMDANKMFSAEKAFQAIDDWNYGYIDKRNLKSFMRKVGRMIPDDQLLMVIRRMDLDADARLSKEEFIEGLKPEQIYSKVMKRG